MRWTVSVSTVPLTVPLAGMGFTTAKRTSPAALSRRQASRRQPGTGLISVIAMMVGSNVSPPARTSSAARPPFGMF